METIHYLLGKILKLVIIIFIAVGVLVLVGAVYPAFKPAKLLDFSFFNVDWLPAPQNIARTPVAKNKDGTYGTLYRPGPAFDGYNTEPNRYITYSYNGSMPTSTTRQAFNGAITPYPDRTRYIRNVSLYEDAPISYGQTIYGEANSAMFRNGIFQIVIIDGAGRPITSMYAINLNTWSVPGWPRWKAVVPIQLPHNIPCALVFLSADGARIGFPVRCN